MAYISIDVELDEFDDDEIIEELKGRGYYVEKGGVDTNEFDREDLNILLELVDTWATSQPRYMKMRIEDKLKNLRWG